MPVEGVRKQVKRIRKGRKNLGHVDFFGGIAMREARVTLPELA